MEKLTLFIDKIAFIIRDYAKYLIALLMLLITYEVFMRRVLNSPTTWNGDVQAQAYAISAVLASAYATITKAHVAVDIFVNKLSFRNRKIFEIIMFLIFVIPLLVASVYSWYIYAADSWAVLEKSLYSPWQPPVYPLKTVLLIGFIFFLIQNINEILKDIVSIQKGSEEWLQAR